MYNVKFLGFILTIFLPFVALAQMNQGNISNISDKPFLYLEAGIGYDFYSVGDSSLYSGDDLVYRTSGESSGNIALNPTVGYQLTKHFAAELGFIFTPSFNTDYTLTTGSDPAQNYQLGVKPWTAYLAGKFSFPIAQRLGGFVKLGAAYQKVKLDDSSADNVLIHNDDTSAFSMLLGFGLNYDITPRVYVFGEGLAYIFNNLESNAFIPLVPLFTLDLDHNATVLFGIGYKFL
jgi:opacity protein-like surface antigen